MDLNWLLTGTRTSPTLDVETALAYLTERGYRVTLERRE